MDNYLGAAIASKSLMDIYIKFHSYEGRVSYNERFALDIQGLFNQLTSTQLSCFRVSDLRGRYEEIVPLCRALGADVMSVCLQSVEIVDGPWATMLELLRSKVTTRCREGLCQVVLSSLTDQEGKVRATIDV